MITSWLISTRPKILILSASPVCIGSAFAFKEGLLQFPFFLLTLFFAFLIQIGTHYANDYFDLIKGSDTETRKGPLRAMHKGLISRQAMKRAIFIVFGAALLVSLVPILKGGIFLGILAFLSIALGFLYTGGPYPLAYVGLSDVFALFFFGSLASLGAYYVHAEKFSFFPFLAGFGPGLISVAVLTVNNLRDIEEDRAAHKKTLAVRLGAYFTKIEYSLSLLGAFLIPVYLVFHGFSSLLLLASCSLLLSLSSLKIVWTSPENLNQALHKTAFLSLPYAVLFCLGILL